jgi:hypothetical protein
MAIAVQPTAVNSFEDQLRMWLEFYPSEFSPEPEAVRLHLAEIRFLREKNQRLVGLVQDLTAKLNGGSP